MNEDPQPARNDNVGPNPPHQEERAVRGGPVHGARPQPRPQPSDSRSFLNRIKSVLLVLSSFLLTGMVIANAYLQRQQFYPTVVYITKSNMSMAIIYVQGFVLVYLACKLLCKLFFGTLRAAEFEHLMERSWYAITETCLIFAMFKEDLSPKFVVLFVLLLCLKGFHWLSEERVDFMERSPTLSAMFHVRIVALNILLAMADLHFILHAIDSIMNKGASVQIVFALEYSIMLTFVINTVVKYILHSIDLYSENPWENKAVFMLYTELFVGFIKVLLYVAFLAVMFRVNGVPIFAMRPIYLASRSFKKALNSVILSRRAIHNMNTLYPDATAEELAATDNVCIICREEMVASPSTKKLPCNHIFHKNCLRSWFQRQQTCPTCRMDVLRTTNRPTSTQQQAQQQPQQGAQPRQPPAPPGFPPGVNPHDIFAQIAAAAAAGAGPQRGQNPPTQSTTATSSVSTSTTITTTASTSSANSNRSDSNNNRSAPPTFLPPFPPPPFFVPFSIPPPMPPANFQGLTDAELRAMEGQERENVEARIRCLRSIQVLLDAAVVQMQQYSTITGAMNRTSAASTLAASLSTAITTASTTASTITSAGSTQTSASAFASGGIPAASTSSQGGAKPKVKQPSPASGSEEKYPDAEKIISQMDAPGETEVKSSENSPHTIPRSSDIDTLTDDHHHEVRRRRLAKFEGDSNN